MARILSTPCQRAADQIAALLHEANITLVDASENGVLDREEVRPLRDQIVAIYRECLDNDIELVISLANEGDYEQLVADALWLQIDSILWDAVDSALWSLQLASSVDSCVDDAIDRMQAGRAA